MKEFDVIVIGTGPSGEAAAMNAAKKRLKVGVIESFSFVGGACTHKGTIPSKALRHCVRQLIHFNNNSLYRVIGEPRWFSFDKILQSAEAVIKRQVSLRTAFYARNRVELIFGEASFLDKHHVIVRSKGFDEHLKAKEFVIATGSHPFRPSGIDFNHPRIYDSDTILGLTHSPRSLIIYGAGVIGCEYASIFSGLGVKVDLINAHDGLLKFLDVEIADALAYHLRDSNVMIRHNEVFDRLETTEKQVILVTRSGKMIKGDALLWCSGRNGNTQGLHLEKVGLKTNQRGMLDVDAKYRTKVPHIHGVGDVIGWPSLASAAYDQGRSAASDIVHEQPFYYVHDVPTGIYTIPEISSVGKTEQELTAENVPYQVGRAFFKNTARAQITGEKVGVLKILFHAETLQILGVHCFGDQAAEIVHIGQAILSQAGAGNSLNYFIHTTFNYPTMAEAYRIAALDGLNRVAALPKAVKKSAQQRKKK